MDKTERNVVVATMVVAAFGFGTLIGTLIGQDPTRATFFGILAVVGTVFLLLFLTIRTS